MNIVHTFLGYRVPYFEIAVLEHRQENFRKITKELDGAIRRSNTTYLADFMDWTAREFNITRGEVEMAVWHFINSGHIRIGKDYEMILVQDLEIPPITQSCSIINVEWNPWYNAG